MTRRGLALDVGIAVLFAAVAFLEAATHGDDGYRGSAPPLLAGSVAAAGALPLALRRLRPGTAFAAAALLASLPHLVVDYDPVFVGGAVALVVAAEAVGRYGRRRRPGDAWWASSTWSLLLLLPALVVLVVTVPRFVADAAVCGALVVAGWLLGLLVRALGERRRALRHELAAREEAEALLAERAVADERTRIARDLHDVIAHCVGVMVLQAGAARLTMTRDPVAAAEAVAQIERTGHEALLELQRVLGLLQGAPEEHQGSVAALDGLTADLAAAGLAVRLRVEGDLGALPPALDRSLYRVVQECLTNALKHGAGPDVDVRLRLDGAVVELEVVNATGAPRAALPGGHGQAGMRERLAAFGGALSAGADAGRYRVLATVPVGAP